MSKIKERTRITMSKASTYYQQLLKDTTDVAARYQQKLQGINGVDPFALRDEDISYQITAYPNITNMDIVSYLVLTTSYYTKQQMKAFKSLNAYKYFEAGFVQQCGVVEITDYIIVIGKVKHSQRMNEPPVRVWIMCHKDGSVESAHCSCMTGAGEVCSHVGAILYALESVHTSRTTTSCTDVLAVWNVPKVSKVVCKPLREMDFGRIIRSHKIKRDIPPISPQEMVDFMKSLEEEGSSSVLMRVVEPFATELVTPEEIIPNIYTTLYNPDLEQLCFEDIMQNVVDYGQIVISEEECHKIRDATVKQAKSPMWFAQRAGRITASKFKAVCKTSLEKPSISLVKTICYPTKFLFRTKATAWGINHEKDGLAAYQAYFDPFHQNLNVDPVGLCVSPTYPQFGASPDAIVTCECCGTGCIEVKCPYLLKDMTIEEYTELKSACVTKTDEGNIVIKKDHAYYYQMQMQMAITGTLFCDFVLWGPNEFFPERVMFNDEFWTSESHKALAFHEKVIMPELFGRYFTKTHLTIETWCTCQSIDDGRPMICCDDDSCQIKWYHLECVGLSDVPCEAWYCNICHVELAKFT